MEQFHLFFLIYIEIKIIHKFLKARAWGSMEQDGAKHWHWQAMPPPTPNV